jgi:hypothetical protein
MKKRLVTFGTLFLFAAGLIAAVQDDAAVAQAAARLAARRAAEDAGTVATPAAPAGTAEANLAASSAGELAADVLRKANLAAAYKELQASSNNMLVSKPFLQMVWQRNVFDPARVPYSPRRYTQPPVIEAFSLRGISEIVGKGMVALFGGDGVPSYPPTRVVGDLLGGDSGRQFEITAITLSNVTLIDTKFTSRPGGSSAAGTITSPEFVLNLDEGLTRTDDGPWTTNTYIPVYPTFVARTPLDAATSFNTPMPFFSGPVSLPAPRNPRVPPNGVSPPGGPLPGRRNPRGPGGRGGVPGFAAPAAVATPAAAPDPIVLARLQAQRSAQ